MPGMKQTVGGPMTPDQALIKLDDIRTEMMAIKEPSSPKYLNLQKEQNRLAKYAYPDEQAIAPDDGA